MRAVQRATVCAHQHYLRLFEPEVDKDAPEIFVVFFNAVVELVRAHGCALHCANGDPSHLVQAACINSPIPSVRAKQVSGWWMDLDSSNP